jgi:hypothetical protein
MSDCMRVAVALPSAFKGEAGAAADPAPSVPARIRIDNSAARAPHACRPASAASAAAAGSPSRASSRLHCVTTCGWQHGQAGDDGEGGLLQRAQLR